MTIPLNPRRIPPGQQPDPSASGAIVTINTVATATDTELTVAGDLRLDATSIFIMNSANDRISVVGNWDKKSFGPSSHRVMALLN